MSKPPSFGHDSPELAGDLRTEAMVLDAEGYNGQRLRDGADHIEALEAENARLRAQRDKAVAALRIQLEALEAAKPIGGQERLKLIGSCRATLAELDATEEQT